MDEAASMVRIAAVCEPPDVTDIEKKIAKLDAEKERAVDVQDYERAGVMRDKAKALREEVAKKKQEWLREQEGEKKIVSENEIALIVHEWTGIPVSRMTESEAERYLQLESILRSHVIGQDDAVAAVCRALRRARAGLKDPQRPIGSFLFTGPTGVGKTELSKTLAWALFDDEEAMIRLDMSEYMEPHSVSKLTGSPPGYVGYEDAGQLTERVRRRPYSVVLLDEIEKAHPDVFNVLLQVLDDGRLTDSKGKTVDFRNTVIIMTSNAGTGKMRKKTGIGFGAGLESSISYEREKESMTAELKKIFRPEFLNRIDEIIIFSPLELAHTKEIAKLMIDSVCERLKEKGIDAHYDDDVTEHMAKSGFDEQYGARPLRRAIAHEIEDGLSEEILSGRISVGDKILITVREDELKFLKE